ncbi:MAG: rhodanese-like domain-containing protein [Magnetovibrionaceae bacterium]
MLTRKLPLLGALVLALGLASISLNAALAADKPSNAKKQTKAELYLTAVEAHQLLQAKPEAILIDVRDPAEQMFTGATAEADLFVPLKRMDTSAWNAKKQTFAMKDNPAFADRVEAGLAKLQAGKDTPLIFMCRSGSRSSKAADRMFARGYTQTYTIIDGFEGAPLKEGVSKGVRALNGWRNSGLPWGYKLPKEKLAFAAMKE